MKSLLTALILLLSQSAYCQEAELLLEVTTDAGLSAQNETRSYAEVGELVRFDLSHSNADTFKWLLIRPSPDFQTYNNGTQAVFSAREPGSYRFVIACSLDGTVDVLTHVIEVRGPPKAPETDSLIAWIPYWLHAVKPNLQETRLLSDSFRRAAQEITDLHTSEEIIQLMANANRAALGPNLSKWVPFLQKIQKVCENRAFQGRLTTPQEHRDLFLEISQGLATYAQ